MRPYMMYMACKQCIINGMGLNMMYMACIKKFKPHSIYDYMMYMACKQCIINGMGLNFLMPDSRRVFVGTPTTKP